MDNKLKYYKSYSFVISPTKQNKRKCIKNKYEMISCQINQTYRIKPKIYYSLFPINLIWRKKNFILIRESVTLYPYLIILTLLSTKFILEINGNPVADNRLPIFIKLFLFKLRDIIVNKNNNCSIIYYSNSEIKKFKNKNKIQVYNFSNRKFIKAKLPRSKNILMLIGNNSRWHGLDNVLELCKILENYNVYIYGLEHHIDHNQHNLYLHKYEDIDKVIKKTDFGYALGSLNYSSKFGNITENSSLKGVLYHYLDLPFISSFNECGCIKNFSININSFDKLTNSDINRIKSFLNYWELKSLDEDQLQRFKPEYILKSLNTII